MKIVWMKPVKCQEHRVCQKSLQMKRFWTKGTNKRSHKNARFEPRSINICSTKRLMSKQQHASLSADSDSVSSLLHFQKTSRFQLSIWPRSSQIITFSKFLFYVREYSRKCTNKHVALINFLLQIDAKFYFCLWRQITWYLLCTIPMLKRSEWSSLTTLCRSFGCLTIQICSEFILRMSCNYWCITAN